MDLLCSIDAADGAPEAADRFVDLDFKAAFVRQFAKIQIGFKANAVTDWRIEFFDETKKRMFALEMVEENQITAGFADPFHFIHDADRIGNRGNEIGGENAVKRGVGKIEVGGVHLLELNAFETERFGAFAGL